MCRDIVKIRRVSHVAKVSTPLLYVVTLPEVTLRNGKKLLLEIMVIQHVSYELIIFDLRLYGIDIAAAVRFIVKLEG